MEKYTEEEVNLLFEDMKVFGDVLNNGNVNAIKDINDVKLQEIVKKVMQTEDIEIFEEYMYDVCSKIDLRTISDDTLSIILENGLAEPIWKTTDKEVQQAKIEEIIDKVKENEYLVREIWVNTDKEVQRANANLLPKIIDQVKEKQNLVGDIWRNTDKEAQRANVNLLPKIIDKVKGNEYLVESIWKNTDKEVQQAKIEEIIDKVKENEYLVGEIWGNTDKEVQRANANLFPKIIDKVKENEYLVGEIWGNTDKEVQQANIEEIINQVKENASSIEQIWKVTNKGVQKKKLDEVFKIIENYIDEDGKSLRNVNSIKAILKNSDPSIISKVWDKITLEEQKDNFKLICDRLCEDSESSQYLPGFLKKIDKDINSEKLTEILTIKDYKYLNNNIMDELILKNIDATNIDIENVNVQINKIHDIFLTNNLPEVFKLFEFFKFHPNNNKNNENFYAGMSNEDRNKIILQDLFTTALDSNNSQMANFLELLHNGNIAYNKKRNGYDLNELDRAMLSVYSDNLFSLYGFYKNEKLDKASDSYDNIDKIRKKLQLDDKADVGDVLLGQFLNKIEFKTEDYQGNRESISLNLLEYMEQERKKSIQRNCKEVDVSTLLEER